MSDFRRQFGDEGEEFAAQFLRQNGYEILERQWRCYYGEIDLICRDGEVYVFVEVKARHDDSYGFPEEAVTPRKRRHLAACAEAYLAEKNVGDVPWRVDVIAIEAFQTPPRLVHLEAIDM